VIDTTKEAVGPFTQAAAQWVPRRRGRRTHVSTLYRWTTSGCCGVVLESIQVGGTRCTSREALQRFFERLSAGQQRTGDPHAQLSTPDGPAGLGAAAPRSRTLAQRQRASVAAGKRLEATGA